MNFSRLYANIFARKFFYKLHRYLFHLSLKGLGVDNYYNSKLSGETYVLKRFIAKKNCVVFDVGANEGNWSLEVLEKNPTVKIFAFEPSPKTFSVLSSRLSKYDDVTPYNFGIGSINGKLSLYDYAQENGSRHASLFKDVIVEQHESNQVVEYQVDMITIDDFMKQNDIHFIDFLKVDTEGYEMECLNGAKEAIDNNKIKIIQFEFNTMHVYSKVFFKDFFDLLSDKYSLYRLIQDGLIPINKYNPTYHELFGFQNILAINKKYQ